MAARALRRTTGQPTRTDERVHSLTRPCHPEPDVDLYPLIRSGHGNAMPGGSTEMAFLMRIRSSPSWAAPSWAAASWGLPGHRQLFLPRHDRSNPVMALPVVGPVLGLEREQPQHHMVRPGRTGGTPGPGEDVAHFVAWTAGLLPMGAGTAANDTALELRPANYH
jgi:hypothetical protein